MLALFTPQYFTVKGVAAYICWQKTYLIQPDSFCTIYNLRPMPEINPMNYRSCCYFKIRVTAFNLLYTFFQLLPGIRDVTDVVMNFFVAIQRNNNIVYPFYQEICIFFKCESG